MNVDQPVGTLEAHTASSIGAAELTRAEQLQIARLFRQHMHPRRGRADRSRSVQRRPAQVVVTVRRGEPAIMAAQNGRHWTINVSVPSGWWERAWLAGLALRPCVLGWPREEVDAGRCDIVLDWQPLPDSGGSARRRWWVIRRPHAQRNIWLVLRLDRPWP